MSSNWAYTAFGATLGEEFAEHFGPSAETAYTSSAAISSSMREVFSDQRDLLHRGRNLIGFDGKNWIVGRIALPFNPEGTMASDPFGRHMHFTHGYTSQTSLFPGTFPYVDIQRYNELQRTHIFPMWGKWGDSSIRPKTITEFAPAHSEIPISKHLPPEAIDILKHAHGEGKPIALHYDAESKQWSKIEGFEKRINRYADQLASKPSVASTTHAAEDTAKNAKSFVSRVCEHPGRKLAIVVGTVALGASLVGVSWWAFKSKQQNKRR
jgi:hypothetical protein